MMTTGAFLVALFSTQLLVASTETIHINVNKVVTRREDEYVCSSMRLKDTIYPIGFETHSKASIAHHILLYACSEPNPRGSGRCYAPCFSREKILYAWARDAKPLQLPEDVSFEIGGDTEYSHLVIQVHYKKRIKKPDSSGITVHTAPRALPKVAGVMLMSANVGVIPKHKRKVPIAIGCQLETKTPISPFAFRVHAHMLARTNFAYLFPSGNTNSPQLVARGSPQWPQAFYPSPLHASMNKGDFLVGFCVYDSMRRNRDTKIGATHKDEMCNVYIMYSRRREDEPLSEADETVCSDGLRIKAETFQKLLRLIPESAFDYLPTKLLEVSTTEVTKSVSETADKAKLTKSTSKVLVHDIKFKVRAKLGQVAGVALDSGGRLFVFHRAERVWNADTFDAHERFRNAEALGPISSPTVLIVDRTSGAVISSFGANHFFLPHGITVDANDSVWLTDVALHQVFRFDKHNNYSTPSLTLGRRLEPGSNNEHFCKPTDVAVQPDGTFFVADGYCNSRIVKFSREGGVLRNRSFGSASGRFVVPHSLAFANRSLLCAADRERARIECFRPSDGKSLLAVQGLPAFGIQLYAICSAGKLSGFGDVLHGVAVNDKGASQGFTLALDGPKVLARWGPTTGRPHDVAAFGHEIFVAELDKPFGVLSFQVSPPRLTPPPPSLAVTVAAAQNLTSKNLVRDPWTVIRLNLPLVIGVVLVVPLCVIGIGALIARLHRGFPKRSRAYKERERAKFKALINEDDEEESGSEGEMTLMEQRNLFKYGAPRASPNPRTT